MPDYHSMDQNRSLLFSPADPQRAPNSKFNFNDRRGRLQLGTSRNTTILMTPSGVSTANRNDMHLLLPGRQAGEA